MKKLFENWSRFLSENNTDLRPAEQTWKSYEGALEDMDDVCMWLNEIGYAFDDYTRYCDRLGGGEEIEALLASNNIQLPITDLKIAVQLYQLAKAT